MFALSVILHRLMPNQVPLQSSRPSTQSMGQFTLTGRVAQISLCRRARSVSTPHLSPLILPDHRYSGFLCITLDNPFPLLNMSFCFGSGDTFGGSRSRFTVNIDISWLHSSPQRRVRIFCDTAALRFCGCLFLLAREVLEFAGSAKAASLDPGACIPFQRGSISSYWAPAVSPKLMPRSHRWDSGYDRTDPRSRGKLK